MSRIVTRLIPQLLYAFFLQTLFYSPVGPVRNQLSPQVHYIAAPAVLAVCTFREKEATGCAKKELDHKEPLPVLPRCPLWLQFLPLPWYRNSAQPIPSCISACSKHLADNDGEVLNVLKTIVSKNKSAICGCTVPRWIFFPA